MPDPIREKCLFNTLDGPLSPKIPNHRHIQPTALEENKTILPIYQHQDPQTISSP